MKIHLLYEGANNSFLIFQLLFSLDFQLQVMMWIGAGIWSFSPESVFLQLLMSLLYIEDPFFHFLIVFVFVFHLGYGASGYLNRSPVRISFLCLFFYFSPFYFLSFLFCVFCFNCCISAWLRLCQSSCLDCHCKLHATIESNFCAGNSLPL